MRRKVRTALFLVTAFVLRASLMGTFTVWAGGNARAELATTFTLKP